MIVDYAEHVTRNEDLDAGTILDVDEIREVGSMELEPIQGGETERTNMTHREMVELARRRNRGDNDTGQDTDRDRRAPDKDRHKKLIQEIAVQIEGGFRLIGACIGPQTKKVETEAFVSKTLSENGNDYLLCGDLNDRHCTWDKT